ncbi:MAG: alpha-amylase, partial [Spirochaetales bacterium]|nr:alpha-amylase [Spirochaetales bacterium]
PTPVENGCSMAGKVGSSGYGAFDDVFRNAIKGSEYPSWSVGHVQGSYKDSGILIGLKGSSTTRNTTGIKGLALHYVECHDNYTLADKLAISMNKGSGPSGWKSYNEFTADQQDMLRKQNKLAAAFIFLSKGTPFINGGQEFMRTKKGDENSYKSDDSVNAIDMSFKTKYEDVYNVYKGLIALRRANTDFTSQASATATKVESGFTKFETGDFLVYFNATDTEQAIDTTGYTKVIDVTTGTPTESTTLPTKVGAKGFVILKK